MSSLRLYLIGYNSISLLGWTAVLALTLQHVFAGGADAALARARTLHASGVGAALYVVETASLLEVLHSALGWVRSPLAPTLLQVAARLIVLWGVTYQSAAARGCAGFALMTAAWASAELPRYGFYLAKLALPGGAPAWLTWLRYSLFLVLYPLGIAGEVLSLLAALPGARAGTVGLHLSLPNAHNVAFSYHVCLLVLLVLYIPGSPYMIGYMIKQRRRELAKGGEKKAE